MLRAILLNILALLTPLAAGAAIEELTLDDAVARAVASSHRLKAAGATALAAQAGADEARAQRLPRIELHEEIQRTTHPVFVFGNLLRQEAFGPANFQIERLNSPDELDNFSTRLTLFQPVWTGGRIAGGVETATGAFEAAGAQRERTRQEVVFDAIDAFTRAFVARHQIEEVEAANEVVRSHLHLARDRFESGLVVESDVLQLEVRESELREALIRAENAVALSAAALNLAIGAAPDSEWLLLDPASTTPRPDEDPAAAIATAQRERPDLLAASARVAAARGRTRVERAGLYPQVGLSGGWEANAENGPGDDGTNWSLQLGVSWTAFDGFATRSRLLRARREAEAAEEMRALLAQRISLEVRTAYLDLAAAAERQTQAERATGLAARNLRIVEDRYREGLVTLVELREAETAATRARARGVASLRDLLLSRARLRLATGTL